MTGNDSTPEEQRSLPDEAIDPAAVLAALGWPEPTDARPVAGGADTALFRVDSGGGRYALRVLRADQAATAKREVAAMQAAAAVGAPVPAVRAMGSWHGRPALLLTWMPGRPLRHELCAHPPAAAALGVAFGRAQAILHRAAAPATLNAEPDAWLDAANPDEALRARLRAAMNGPAALLHLDYHPMNVLIDVGQVAAVLDWSNARAGDPRADLARTASILRFAPPGAGRTARDSEPTRRALEHGWRRGYQEVAGPVNGMAPFYAWAGDFMVRDLAPRLGRADLPWITEAFLDRIRDWSQAWRAHDSR